MPARPGFINSFQPGARRDGQRRDYRVEFVPRQTKAGAPIDDRERAPGTLYTLQEGGVVQLGYRIYLPA